MDATTLIIILAIGAISGWLAGQIRNGYGFGLLGNIVVGILGSFLGGWIFRQMGVGVNAGLLGTIFVSVIGALVLLFLIGLVRRSS
ncbi:MAG TPA: GlsB/YeaQ/YmgE family stress response membrane protein [Saprospiraceae bacterium]|nr:GlsB/YeaQ/YmgE family stress response membrane protein [Saprospiraceae bacterium]HNM26006.1 GlsB/YeaQ/YmgE family stress response membrane protein [Saprospiraceae bacterium]